MISKEKTSESAPAREFQLKAASLEHAGGTPG
jgi:hypothetical protein